MAINESKECLSDAGAAITPLVPQGALLLSFKLSLGKLAFAGKPLRTNEAIAALIPNDFGVLIPEFLYWYLKSFDWATAARGSEKVKGATLNKAKLKEILVPLPPLAEQKRIIAILDEAFEGIAKATANAERNLVSARIQFQRTLDQSFDSDQLPGKPLLLEAVLDEQPRNGWSPPAADHCDSGTPVLTLSAVTGHKFRADKIKYTSAPTDPGKHYWIQNGDLLIGRSNTRQLVGHVAVANGISTPTLYPDLIMRMRANPQAADVTFLWFQLRTEKLRNEIMKRAHGANPTMVKLAKGDVQALPIILPPVRVQQALVSRLEAMQAKADQLSLIYEQKLSLLDELRTALLHKAFSGQLTGKEAIAA